MIVDSHCHLDHFTDAERAGVVARAHAAGVTEMVTISTRLAQAPTLIGIAEAHEGIWCTAGVHPHYAGEHDPAEPETIAALADHPRLIGIGESGLDYFYDKAPRAIQDASFRAHIRAARLADVPLVVHARDADQDVAAILEQEHVIGGRFAFVLHCFSSGRALAERGLALGGYISFSGMLTFPKSEALRTLAAALPADRLLVETDSPYLAPVPFRGKRCEPAYTRQTADQLAAIRGIEPQALHALTTANFRRLFRKAA